MLASVKKVEQNLMPAVRFEGDVMWNLEDRMKYYSISGLSIAVIKDGAVLWRKNYGVADRESQVPVTDQTLFQAASISKTLSTYAALLLVELEKIIADEDINKYLTSWKVPDNEFTTQKKIALNGLLSHSTGITVHGFPGYTSETILPSVIEVLDDISPANTAAIRVDKVPGGTFRYSGGGYTILQQVLMDIEGKPFPIIMKDLVLFPKEFAKFPFHFLSVSFV